MPSADSIQRLPYSGETLARFLIWRFGGLVKIGKLKTHQIITCLPMALRIQIAKFKLRQYLLRAKSPNLMLTKLSHSTVYDNIMT